MASLQQTVPTATIAKAAADAMAAQGNATRSMTSMWPGNVSGADSDGIRYQDANTPVPSSQPNFRTPVEGHVRSSPGDEDGLKTLLTLRQKTALA
ncbi:hypothetical protein MRX96_031510 [Rhipicephalus microplus]